MIDPQSFIFPPQSRLQPYEAVLDAELLHCSNSWLTTDEP